MAAIRRNYWTIQHCWSIEIYKTVDRSPSENETMRLLAYIDARYGTACGFAPCAHHSDRNRGPPVFCESKAYPYDEFLQKTIGHMVAGEPGEEATNKGMSKDK